VGYGGKGSVAKQLGNYRANEMHSHNRLCNNKQMFHSYQEIEVLDKKYSSQNTLYQCKTNLSRLIINTMLCVDATNHG
jgi:hypothetical protein